ncbi:MAG: fructosamine kinase family protein, partial [Pseudomonadota bacterium]
IAQGIDQDNSWLALDYLVFTSSRVVKGQAALGEALAAMHGCSADAFGWYRPNYIGSNRQPNSWTADCPDFIRKYRIGFQLEMAQRAGLHGSISDRISLLLAELHRFYDNYKPAPSLLHGDLWSGNYGVVDDIPVIFDPAVYYGDREADIAMTELFGGFSAAFYSAYRTAWQLDPGYDTRRDLHQLYHVLNHFNLFGGAYARQALALTNRLLAAIS